MRLAALAAVVAVALVFATGASALTGDQAVKKASACLMSHGAKSVATGVVGNASVSFGAGQNADFAFTLTKAWPIRNGTATGVKSLTYDRRMVAAKRLVVKRCVYGAVT